MELKVYRYKCRECGNTNRIEADWFNNQLKRKTHKCEFCLHKITLNVEKIRKRDYNNFTMRTEVIGSTSKKDTKVYLLVSSPNGNGQFEIRKENNEIFIGRGDVLEYEKGRPHYKLEDFSIDTLLKLPDKYVSRRHAVIKRGGLGDKALLLVELGSMNGTYINGIKLKTGDEVMLFPGSKIKLGETNIIIGN